MNKVILIGNLGKDPEVKQLENNKVANFSLATTYGKGENKTTEWHNIVTWGKVADVVEMFLKKGSKVCVDGRISYESYKDKNDVEKHITKIVAGNVEILSHAAEKQENEIPKTDDLPF